MPSFVRISFAAFALLTLSLGNAGCDNPNPGTALGTFKVTSALSADTCGGTAATSDPGNFDVTISNDDGVVYWFPSTGGTSSSGQISSARTVEIREAVADDVDEVEGGSGACTLQRNDVLSFTLAAGTAPATFSGSYSFTVVPADGANCADQLTTAGGGYGALPCTITYSLSGTRM
jgi:hypothetical protein